MAATTGAPPTVFTAIRFEANRNSSNGRASPFSENQSPILRPLLSVSKRSLIVKTESNVRLERRQKPEPPCVVCRGTGKVNCPDCRGKGRTNKVQLAMLPKGEWPKWCRACGGSGLGYCSRCLGTGEYRYQVGFHLQPDRDESDETREYKNLQNENCNGWRFCMGKGGGCFLGKSRSVVAEPPNHATDASAESDPIQDQTTETAPPATIQEIHEQQNKYQENEDLDCFLLDV